MKSLLGEVQSSGCSTSPSCCSHIPSWPLPKSHGICVHLSVFAPAPLPRYLVEAAKQHLVSRRRWLGRLGGGRAGGVGYGSADAPPAHLGDVEVDAEALPIALHLPHPHLAGQVTGAGADTLQGEGAVQKLLGAIPDVIKGDLLGEGGREAASGVPSSRCAHSRTLSTLTW